MKRFVATGLLLCAGAAMAEEPLVFRASAKVSVSAAGEVTGVEPDASLSPALQKLVREEVLGYRFEPPTHGGRAVDGTTYVALGGCAVPEREGYRVSLAYKGAGPRVQSGQMVPPRYPERAYMNGSEADATVTYIVQPDGSVVLDRIDYKGHPRTKREFDKALKEWIEQMRYEPEALAGEPVRTKLEVPVDFKLGDGDLRSEARRLEQQRLSSPECTAATSQPSLEPVAVDTPFRRLPSG